MTRRLRISVLLGLVLGVSTTGAPPAAASEDPATTAGLEVVADGLWDRRADGASGAQASATTARRLVEAHEQALASDPQSLRLRWKLLRALHFEGDFAIVEEDLRLEVFEAARAIADTSRALLSIQAGSSLDDLEPPEIARAISSVPHAIDIYYYSAIHWGLWGRTTGKVKAARQGVGGRIRDFAQVVTLLDERYETAGGHRFLGRLHTEAPRIPFVTGWIDRELAVQELERACEIAPEEPINLLYLADALLQFDPGRREEALDILRRLVATPPRQDRLVEDAACIRDARELLRVAAGS
jgi:tetratricopeptide (TPR) repeat protein